MDTLLSPCQDSRKDKVAISAISTETDSLPGVPHAEHSKEAAQRQCEVAKLIVGPKDLFDGSQQFVWLEGLFQKGLHRHIILIGCELYGQIERSFDPR
jgi:hypothetical protein